MEIDQETSKRIQELQLLEQSYQNILIQKQTFQVEANESKTALEEINKSKGDVFRVLGQVMIKADPKQLKKELKEKKDILDMKLKAVDKQELGLREQIERLRSDVMSKINQ